MAVIPKPKRPRKPAVIVYRDGREECTETPSGKLEYKRRIEAMRQRQQCVCCYCMLYLGYSEACFAHQLPRRMGAGFRDDRIMIDGMPVSGAAHVWCNSLRGSDRGFNAGDLLAQLAQMRVKKELSR